VLLHGLEFRLAPTFPRWLSTVSIVVAVLLIGSFFAAPGFLLPIWTIVVGLSGRRATVDGDHSRDPSVGARPT
jgi:hypothetical protein